MMQNGETALIRAAGDNFYHTEVTSVLLAHGRSNINARQKVSASFLS